MPQTVQTQKVGKIPVTPPSNRWDSPNFMNSHYHASLISSSDVGKIHALYTEFRVGRRIPTVTTMELLPAYLGRILEQITFQLEK